MNGTVTYIDLIDSDLLSCHELVSITQKLGYPDEQKRFFHFVRPDSDLQFGLQALGNDSDIQALLKYVPECKLFDVYTEHWETRLDTYLKSPTSCKVRIEQLPDEETPAPEKKNVEVHEAHVEAHVEVTEAHVEVEVPKVPEVHVEIPESLMDAFDPFFGINFNDDFDQPGRCMDDQAAKGMDDQAARGMDDEVDDGMEDEVDGMEDEVPEVEAEVDSGMVDEGNIIQDAVDVDVDMSNFKFSFVDSDIDVPVNLDIRFRCEVMTSEEACPWVLHVSPVRNEETWMVKTYTDTHKCLQTRAVNACTASFLADHIVQTIAPNPEILIRAVKEQLEKKYAVSVSVVKSFRAKTMALNKLRGDYAQQYGLLRRYLLEVKRTNPDTTVKIDVEPPIDPSSPTRQFKRVYICLGPLKQGFKACQRDLLGLDGCFMKGPYPGHILTAVGVDPNHGTYPLAYAVVEAENKKKCAAASTVPMFNKAMDELKAFNGSAHGWLRQIPPQHWSKAYFTAATKMLDKNKAEAVDYDIIWNGGIEYEVSGPWQDQVIVNVQKKTCTCRHWELTGMPCKHAVATIWYMAMNGEGAGLPEQWAHECYWLSTWKKVYDFKLSPINGPKLWPENDCPTILTPPKHHIQVGRPKKKRLRTTDDASQFVVKGSKVSRAGTSVTCVKCHKKGHNSRTCKGI
ncbi:hypothetical protein OSB04_002113 [Centaurea solstitialis]|uniref:SWIM-type domain-containing protein n=1 Tax=Centaurea solstitialis TaxID=347529 RepID=A0AA38WM19_9ASTR|nr:hypothetical protein OSB04_002113 [Centaurea solstitialis]